MQDYVDKAVTWTRRNVQESGIYLVLDRYIEYSIKDNPRNSRQQFKFCGHKLVVTGRDPIPVEIHKGIVIRRCNLKTVQEETDVIMSRQMIAISEELDGTGIRVMFDDTDVFMLLLYFYRLREMWCSINEISWQHMSDLDLTQWPSVIGKGKLVKVLKAGHTLFWRQLHSWQNVMENTSPLL